MKISLFIKPSVAKACLFAIFVIYLVGQPVFAYAGFFSGLFTKILGTEAQATVVPVIEDDSPVIHNSQTVPLLESGGANPDLKNIKDDPQVLIVSGEALLPNNNPLADDDGELDKYGSSEKIDVYIVKEGDTLLGIANKLKVSSDTILAANTDLKKEDLLKVGQHLVIIGLKDGIKTTPTSESKPIAKEEKPEPAKVEAPATPKEPDLDPAVQEKARQDYLKAIAEKEAQTQNALPQTPEQSAPVENEQSGQPKGTIVGGYIWPFPTGVGRVSQGLHADNAYDFAAPKNTPIYAIQSGTVFIAHPTGYNGGFGKYVVINFEDGRQAIFGHMNSVAVSTGDVVKQGDVIGFVGTTGKSTGYHTHIGFHGPLSNPYKGLKVNSTTVDHD